MKKRIRYIIPPSFYKRVETKAALEREKIAVSTPTAVVETPKTIQPEVKTTNATPSTEVKQTTTPPKSVQESNTPKITGRRRSSSALSLKSLKKEKEKITTKKKIDYSNMPKEKFSQAAFDVNWTTYVDILNRQGNKMLASILNTSKPVLNDTVVTLTYPNSMMAEELRKHQSGILNHLREKLQNYQISFNIIVDEKEEKTYAYSPQDKYTKLFEINPLIEEMRRVLFLDI